METRDIQGGEQYLGFARSLIKKLRLTGQQRFNKTVLLPGATITVRADGAFEHITIRGGAYFYVFIKAFSFVTGIRAIESVVLRFDLSKFATGIPKLMHEAVGGFDPSTTSFIPGSGSSTGMPVAEFSSRTGFNKDYDALPPGSPKVPHAVGVNRGVLALHHSVGRIVTVGLLWDMQDIDQSMTWGDTSATWLGTGDGFISASPTWFKDSEMEYSRGADLDAGDWQSYVLPKGGVEAPTDVPATKIILPGEAVAPDYVLTTRTEPDPSYTRREVGWGIQGPGFIQKDTGTLRDRRYDNEKAIDGTNFHAIPLSRNKFVRFKDDVTPWRTLELCTQADDAMSATVISTCDLSALDDVTSRSTINDCMQATGYTVSGIGNRNSLLASNFSFPTRLLEIALVPDQAALYAGNYR